jgi:hypothetical protein
MEFLNQTGVVFEAVLHSFLASCELLLASLALEIFNSFMFAMTTVAN